MPYKRCFNQNMLYRYGCSIRLTVWPFGTRTSCKISDNLGFSLLRSWSYIVIIIRYIFGQLFFMPCRFTCQAWSKEVPINDRTRRIRYSPYYVLWKFIEIYFAAHMNFPDIFIGNHSTKHFELFPSCLCMLYCCIATL